MQKKFPKYIVIKDIKDGDWSDTLQIPKKERVIKKGTIFTYWSTGKISDGSIDDIYLNTDNANKWLKYANRYVWYTATLKSMEKYKEYFQPIDE